MKQSVPFLDLRIINKTEKKHILRAIDKVLTHGRIVLGPEVGELEAKVAKFCGRKYAVGVNSGTDALILGLKSLGIGPGDEVITTSLSWIATANAIALLGATPVFADIGDDLNIDPASIDRMITRKTKAILPVHYTGKVCEMDQIMKIARKHSLLVVEDAAQAFSAKYKGKLAGSWGDVGCFSMNPMKVWAALGESGMVLTDNQKIYQNLTYLRYNGTRNKEECVSVSLNGRIDTLQAAVLLVRFNLFKQIIQKRQQYARYYYEQLAGSPGIISLPTTLEDEHCVYYTYIIRAEKRDELKAYLAAKGIETKIQHPYLMPDQSVYLGCPRDKITNARKIIREILSLPIHEKLHQKDVSYIAKCVKDFYKSA